MPWVTLDGYEVVAATDLAVQLQNRGNVTWVPRSVMLDGNEIGKGDTELVIQQWYADQEGLD